MIGQERIKLFDYESAGGINPVGIYTWDTVGLAWQKQVTITSGGGGGAVTIADGADVAEGFTTDAAVVTDTTGTVSGKLRGLVKWAFERMPASLGQKTMAASLPVVIASDQSAVPVSGTVAISGAVAVTGPLTDAQLRATAVPVSQSGAWSTGRTWVLDGATDDVAIIGSVAVTGPLTDAQLRATPVPVSGTVSTKTDLTPSAPVAASVGVASAQALAANAARKGVCCVNTSDARISLGFGAAAVLDSGVTLYPGDSFHMEEYDFDVGAINAIASAAASNLAIQEYAT